MKWYRYKIIKDMGYSAGGFTIYRRHIFGVWHSICSSRVLPTLDGAKSVLEEFKNRTVYEE